MKMTLKNKEWKGKIEDMYTTSIKIFGKTFSIAPGEIREKALKLNLGDYVIALHDPSGSLIDINLDPFVKKGGEQQSVKPKVKEAEPIIIAGETGAAPKPAAAPVDVKADLHIQQARSESQPSTTQVAKKEIEVPPKRWFGDEKNETLLLQFCINRAVEIVNFNWETRISGRSDDYKKDNDYRLTEIKRIADEIFAYAKTKLREKE
jgi:hypothetical protein